MNSPFKFLDSYTRDDRAISMTPGFIKRSENKSVGGIDPESTAKGSKVNYFTTYK